jgi:hypothetical protein
MVIRRFQGCYDGFGRCFVRVGRRSRLLHRLILRRRRGGEAGSLIDFQLAEIAVDGELGGGFIASEAGEEVGFRTIDHEGTGEAVVGVRRVGGGRVGLGLPLVIYFLVGQFPFAVVVRGRDAREAVAEEGRFHGKGVFEAPHIGGDVGDQHFLAFADGAKGIVEVFEEQEEVFGIIVVKQDVFVGAQSVDQAIAAGCGLTGIATRSG